MSTKRPEGFLKMSKEVLAQLSTNQKFMDEINRLSEQEKMQVQVTDYVEELRQTYGDLTGVEWYEVQFLGGADNWVPTNEVLHGQNPPPFSIECHHVQATYYEFCRWDDHPWRQSSTYIPDKTPFSKMKEYQTAFDHQWAVEELTPKGWVPFRKMETTELLARLHSKTSFLSLLEADLYTREQLFTLKEKLAESFGGEELSKRQWEVMKALVELDSWE